MPTIKCTVKWSGKKFDVDLDTSLPAGVFKAQLQTLTGVEPERQKIMVKGGILKDDTDMDKLGIKEGHQFMMMGTPGELPKEPPKKTVFVEDMTEAELAQSVDLPPGLVNLGNTCYMNATLQAIRVIPELQEALKAVNESLGLDNRKNVAIALKGLFNEMSNTVNPVTPLVFLTAVRQAYPQFAEAGRGGVMMQQDAEELYTSVKACLKELVPGRTLTGDVTKDTSFVKQFMEGEMETTLTCDEAPQEAPVKTKEDFQTLQLAVSGGAVSYLLTDMENSLVDSFTKNSPSLGRDALYTKKSRISRLPMYLFFHLKRFQWKATERVRAKVLKRIKFPLELDTSAFLTPELLSKIQPARDYARNVAEAKATLKKQAKNGTVTDVVSPKTSLVSMLEEQQKLMTELGLDDSLKNDVGACVTGIYDLSAIVTHSGRSAEGGHYVAWVRRGEEWLKYDDDKVTVLPSADEIAKLEGGGEYHGAYLLLYKARLLEPMPKAAE